MQSKKLTICLPLRNSEKYLPTVFDSLLRQTFQDFCIIVSDNNSSDRTKSICDQYSYRFTSFVYFRQEALIDVEQQFKFLYSKVETPYITWVADDDFYDDDWLEVCMNNVTPSMAAFGRVQYVDHMGKPVRSLANLRPVSFINESPFVRKLKFLMTPDYYGQMILFWGVYPTRCLFEHVYSMRAEDRMIGVDKIFVYRFISENRFFSGLDSVFYKRIHLSSDSSLTGVGIGRNTSTVKKIFRLIRKRGFFFYWNEPSSSILLSLFIFLYPYYCIKSILYALPYFFHKLTGYK